LKNFGLTIAQLSCILTERGELILVGFVFYLLIALAVVAAVFSLIYWVKDKKDGG